MSSDTQSSRNQDQLEFRRAVRADVAAIVTLLADDVLGSTRELPGDDGADAYLQAFDEISADPNQLLCVATRAGEVVATLQLTFIPGLSHAGARRGQIESVRVSSAHRGRGIGEALISWAIEECRARGCSIVQLTTDRRREEALKFYERQGFVGTHVGLKLRLR